MQCRVAAVMFLLNLLSITCAAPHEGLPLLNPGGIGGIFKGPDSETIIRGPDGSEITSEEKGGLVVRDNIDLKAQPIVVAEPENVNLSPSIVSVSTVTPPVALDTQPALLTGEAYIPQEVVPNIVSSSQEPLLLPAVPKRIDIVEQEPHLIETEIIAAPDVEPDQESDLKGPSGRIITKGSASIVSGPASTTITEPRKVIIATPKISKEVPIITAVPITPQTHVIPAPLQPTPSLSYPVTPAPALEYGYSTVANPIGEIPFDSNKIDLGPGSLVGGYSPVVDYGASNGVLTDVSASELSGISTASPPIITGSPSSYLVPPPPSPSLSPQPLFNDYDTAYVASTPSPYIQKIPKGAEVVLDGRVDMGYRVVRTPSYELPQVLSRALSEIYGKPANSKIKEKNVVIDDKLGELSQNEINTKLIPTLDTKPDLTQSKYIGPALLKNGVDLSQVNLAPVPLSDVLKFQEY